MAYNTSLTASKINTMENKKEDVLDGGVSGCPSFGMIN